MNMKKKKRGFTLTELLVVMAIIAVLATIIAPKAIGYLQEAKKSKATEEARQVVLAVEAYNINSKSPIENTAKFSDFITTLSASNYIETSDVEYIDDDNTYEQLKNIIKQNVSFEINDSGKIQITNKE